MFNQKSCICNLNSAELRRILLTFNVPDSEIHNFLMKHHKRKYF